MTVIHGSVSLWHVIVVGFWIVGQKCAAIDLSHLETVLGDAVLSSLDAARITVKEAAALMKIDESQLRKGLRGEPSHHISLNRLVRLPFAFWMQFSPSLVYLVAKKNAQEIAEDLGMRKGA